MCCTLDAFFLFVVWLDLTENCLKNFVSTVTGTASVFQTLGNANDITMTMSFYCCFLVNVSSEVDAFHNFCQKDLLQIFDLGLNKLYFLFCCMENFVHAI